MARPAYDPYDPRRFLRTIERRLTRSVAYSAGTVQMIATADVSRVALFVFFDSTTTLRTIRPDPVDADWGVLPQEGQQHIAILSSDYPVLCQQEWYYGTALGAPATLRVIEVFRRL